MLTLLKDLYCRLKKEEIEKSFTILKRIKIDTILQNISKVCWKNNVQYKIIVKTSSSVSLLLTGYSETVVFKYHKSHMVSKEELDFFMNMVDLNKANKGVYITTGTFDFKRRFSFRSILLRRDIILLDGITFIKGQLGFKGTAENLGTNKINLFKYLPD